MPASGSLTSWPSHCMEMSTAKVGGAMTSRYPRAWATARSTCTGSVEPTASANSRILAEPTAYGWVGGYSRPTKYSLTGIRKTLVRRGGEIARGVVAPEGADQEARDDDDGHAGDPPGHP